MVDIKQPMSMFGQLTAVCEHFLLRRRHILWTTQQLKIIMSGVRYFQKKCIISACFH